MKRHIPYRTCLVTREKLPKKQLARIVKTKDGRVLVDETGKLSGRGANLKLDASLIDTAIEKGMLKRALRLDRNLTEEEKENLKKDFKALVEEKSFRGDNKSVKIRVKKKEFEKVKDND